MARLWASLEPETVLLWFLRFLYFLIRLFDICIIYTIPLIGLLCFTSCWFSRELESVWLTRRLSSY